MRRIGINQTGIRTFLNQMKWPNTSSTGKFNSKKQTAFGNWRQSNQILPATNCACYLAVFCVIVCSAKQIFVFVSTAICGSKSRRAFKAFVKLQFLVLIYNDDNFGWIIKYQPQTVLFWVILNYCYCSIFLFPFV